MFKSLFSFKGRIRRTEFILTVMLRNVGFRIPSYLLVILLVLLSIHFSFDPRPVIIIYGILLFFATIPVTWIMLAQATKRCHDMGRSGWFMLIPFYMLWMYFCDGDKGENKYGASPKKEGETLKGAKILAVILYIIWTLFRICLLIISFLLDSYYMKEDTDPSLGKNEYTDGNIVFNCPEDFAIKGEQSELLEDATFFVLNDDNGTEVIIYTDSYDWDRTIDAFENTYWKLYHRRTNIYNNPLDETVREMTYEGDTHFYTTTMYDVSDDMLLNAQGDTLYWHLHQIFFRYIPYYCIISAYDYGDDAYLKEIIESIRILKKTRDDYEKFPFE